MHIHILRFTYALYVCIMYYVCPIQDIHIHNVLHVLHRSRSRSKPRSWSWSRSMPRSERTSQEDRRPHCHGDPEQHTPAWLLLLGFLLGGLVVCIAAGTGGLS